MNGRLFGTTLIAAIVAGLGLSQLASGQAAPAQPAEASDQDLSEIVVTARRVEERAQDVPISMTVFSQQALSDRNIVTTTDLAAATPSVAVDNGFGNDVSSFAIRGFVQQTNTTPSVAVYFADAVVPRGGAVGEPAGSGVAPGSFFDLQNVQVLKGPQGTLFGRNTDGGAVLLVPKKPTSDFEGYVEGGYGNYAMGSVEGVLNIPFGDAVRVRLGVNHETRNGYLENVTAGGSPDALGNLNYTAARGSVVVDITPDLENYTVGTYNLSVNAGIVPQVNGCNTAQALGALLCPQLAAELKANGDYAVSNPFPGAESYLKQYQLINTTSWHPVDNLTVKNVANYGLLITKLDSSLFGAYGNECPAGFCSPALFSGTLPATTSNPTALGALTTDQYTWSDELQLSGNLMDNRFIWQGGGYIERSGPKGELTGTKSNSFLSCQDVASFLCTGPGLVDINTSTVHYEDLAAFAQVSYKILDQLKATGGIRYTTDITTAQIAQTNYGPLAYPPFGTGGPGNIPAPTCQVTSLSPAAGCLQNLRQQSSAPTYTLGLDYTPIQDLMIYAKYSRGYRQGAVAPFALEGFQVYAPEFVNSYELGEKYTFTGPIQGTFDVTGHYNAFSDQQLLAGFVPPGGVPSAGIVNAGKSRIWGIEVESTLAPIKSLTFALSYAYLNTELLTAFTPNAFTQYPTSVGNVLPFSPKNKGTVSGTYHLPIRDDFGNVSLSANFTYTSGQLISQIAAPFDSTSPYGLLGANLHWDNIMRSTVDAELFGTNLANRLYYNNLTQVFATPFGFAAGYLGEPRMYGIRVRIRFGKT
jgi:iron complex outermembrane receptor protein